MGLFKKDDAVLVKSLKREGIVIEVLKDGAYRVAIGAMSSVRQESDLKALPPDQYKKFSAMKKPRVSAPKVDAPERGDFGVDLHGMRLEEAMKLVEKKLNDAILADVPKFKILHGVGMGILMTNIHKYLRTLSVVKKFELDQNNPGVTWVYF